MPAATGSPIMTPRRLDRGGALNAGDLIIWSLGPLTGPGAGAARRTCAAEVAAPLVIMGGMFDGQPTTEWNIRWIPRRPARCSPRGPANDNRRWRTKNQTRLAVPIVTVGDDHKHPNLLN